MKKIFIIIIIATFSFASCKKKVDDVSTVVKATYPTVTLTGDAILSFPVGAPGPYVDPGANGTNDMTNVTAPLTPILNNVDLTSEGLYTVVYRQKNDNGFYTDATRFVLVTSANTAADFSGLWQRNADATRPANMLKVGAGCLL